MSPPRIVTFTTDFGLEDGFVGQMKGAALAVCPELQFVDITHHVPAHDIPAGALHLKMAYAAFPPSTIHVAVVDPGVGTSRRPVAVRTESYYFVAPDNGVLSMVLDEQPAGAAHVLEATHLRNRTVSATFEGRDVFAPAAAWIARGIELARFGPAVRNLTRLDLPSVDPASGRPFAVRVLLVDRFGNVTLNLPRRALRPGADGSMPRIRVETSAGPVETLHRTYGEAPTGNPFLVFNSADYLELALRQDRASDRLGLRAGDEVTVSVE